MYFNVNFWPAFMKLVTNNANTNNISTFSLNGWLLVSSLNIMFEDFVKLRIGFGIGSEYSKLTRFGFEHSVNVWNPIFIIWLDSDLNKEIVFNNKNRIIRTLTHQDNFVSYNNLTVADCSNKTFETIFNKWNFLWQLWNSKQFQSHLGIYVYSH